MALQLPPNHQNHQNHQSAELHIKFYELGQTKAIILISFSEFRNVRELKRNLICIWEKRVKTEFENLTASSNKQKSNF